MTPDEAFYQCDDRADGTISMQKSEEDQSIQIQVRHNTTVGTPLQTILIEPVTRYRVSFIDSQERVQEVIDKDSLSEALRVAYSLAGGLLAEKVGP